MIWLTVIKEFLSKYWKIAIFAFLFSIACWYRHSLIETIDDTKQELVATQKELDSKNRQLDSLESALKIQKESIDKFVAENKGLQSRLTETVKKNQDLSQSYQKKINEINKDTVPSTCEGAMNYLKGYKW